MGSIPVGGTIFFAPVAQLDRVPGYELGGRGFESLRARHFLPSVHEAIRMDGLI